MKRTIVTVGVLALLLLVAVPAKGAPSLQKGNQATYDLSAAISFLQSCNTGVSTSSNIIVCPMIATIPSTFDINGTLGWTVVDLSNTSASLNVTRNLTISNGESGTLATHTSGSFIESINLATRIVALLPIIMPEVDQALQIAQTNIAANLPSGVNWTSSASMLDNTMMRIPLYTMWWVNGALKLNQTVPVLVVPTNVTKASSIDLGSTLGTRTAWTLVYSLSRPLIPPVPVATSPSIPISNGLEIAFTFNYDKTSDILLTANADIHFGFAEETTVQPNPCSSPGPSISCPAISGPTIIIRQFGIDIQAGLKLVSTTVNLTHPMTQTSPPPTGNSGTQSGTGSSSDTGTGTGAGSGSSSGPSTGESGQHSTNPAQPRSFARPALISQWLYSLLGIVAASVIGSGVWIARRRLKKTAPKTSMTQPLI